MNEGGAFFTLSLLIDGEQIDRLWRDSGGGAATVRWTETLIKRVQAQYSDSERLHAAIEPMFDDIADRSRNLFLREFLLDTPNEPAPAPTDPAAVQMRNVCAEVSLELARGVHWATEGRREVAVDLGDDDRVRFEHVLCRAFWMAHSNKALSYHLSLEVPFTHTLRDYFGLSMLQKAFFASENTGWLHDDAGDGWQVHRAQGAQPLLPFIERLFETHVQHLMQRIARVALADTVPVAFGERAWQRLVLGPHGEALSPSQAWAATAHRRRLLVVLRDAEFFATLEQSRRDGARLLRFAPCPPSPLADAPRDVYRIDDVRSHIEAHARLQQDGAIDAQRLQRDARRLEMALFLSGFLQNIVDFLQQDDLEVQDGLVPIYPPAQSKASNEGFMLYATPSVLYEVVASSRSLDGAGRQWIGTCPYIFLVHMTAFHNESLVHAYEDNVFQLVRHLEERGLRADADAANDRFEPLLEHALECIRDFRLVTFEQVHKHYSFNVFRYETEQTFFATIEAVRGVVQRRAYWDQVLQHLTETINGLQQDRASRFQHRIGLLGLVLAATGVVQTWFAVFPLPTEREPAWLFLLGTLLLPVAALVLWLRHRRELVPKTIRPSSKAWRASRATASAPPGAP